MTRGRLAPTKWTAAEDLLLVRMANSGATCAEIVRALEAELFSPRTHAAVFSRVGRLGLSLFNPDRFALEQLKRMFGVHRSVLQACCKAGLLKGSYMTLRSRNGRAYGFWTFTRADVEQFIRSCQWAYDLGSLRGHCNDRSLVSLAEVAHRSDPWLDVGQAAAELGVSRKWLLHRVRQGVVEHKQRVGGRHDTHKVVIRARLIPDIRDALDHAVDEARRLGVAKRPEKARLAA